MNPSISFDIDLNNKAANSSSGMVTVGAKVDVSVVGLPASVPEWKDTDDFTGKSLRFRVVDAMGRDLVRFPLVKKTADSNGDAWTVNDDRDKFTATGVEFDTAQLREAMLGMPYDAKMEFGVILDSIVDDAQYAVGKLKVKQWAACPTDDPTVLTDWRETLVRLDADLVAVEAKKTEAETAANTATEKAAAAGNSATAASVSAGAAATSAAKANEYANGKTVNGVVTKGAKQYAADAAASATNLAQAVTDAQTAQTAAETAQGKAEDAQEAAETAAGNAETVLASAVKTTEQTLTDGEKTQARTNIGAASASALTAEVNRASAAESANATAISNEATRAQNAESALSSGKQNSLSQNQLAAANSGVTAQKVSGYDAHMGNGNIHVTAEQKEAWSAKQSALSEEQLKTLGSAVKLRSVFPGTVYPPGTVKIAAIDPVNKEVYQTGLYLENIPVEYVKSATVANGKLTLTPNSGNPVEFQGGSVTKQGVIDTGLSASDIGAAVESHTHTQDQITDFGGPYLPTSGINGGSIGYGNDPSASGESVKVNRLYSLDSVYADGSIIPITDDENGPLSRILQYGGNFKSARQEVEDALPYSSTSTPADRTCATVTVASTGASVTVPKPSTESKITAFAVYLDMTALTGTAPSIGFKYPLGEGETEAQDADILTRGGEGLSYETGAVNAVFFIQCGTKYIASAQVYK